LMTKPSKTSVVIIVRVSNTSVRLCRLALTLFFDVATRLTIETKKEF